MSPDPAPSPPTAPESIVKRILEWLALAHGRTSSDDAEELHQQLLLLREVAMPGVQRLKLLDLLYAQSERVTLAEIPHLREVALPISRKQRQRVRSLLDLLAILAQDYFNTLAELFDPLGENTPRAPHTSLRRAMHAIAWQVRLAHLVAAPPPLGIWQQLHAAFRNACRLGLENIGGTNGDTSIRRTYTDILLAAIAQPASFAPVELEFITEYIEQCTPDIPLSDTPPTASDCIYWIDPERDLPAHALVRRSPNSDSKVLYFSCQQVAATALQHRDELTRGVPADRIGLPAFAGSHGGPGVLLRLGQLWGQPIKRRFPRRRQSYRAKLCHGLENLWQLIKHPDTSSDLSEWMVTNESPDGYALMHIAGQTNHLRVGDIVALQATEGQGEPHRAWSICLVRWALSENPEHIELGLQMLAPRAIAIKIASPSVTRSNTVEALILPPTPPLRTATSLVVPAGLIDDDIQQIVALFEEKNLSIREFRLTQLDDQTSAIEIFSVSPESPS